MAKVLDRISQVGRLQGLASPSSQRLALKDVDLAQTNKGTAVVTIHKLLGQQVQGAQRFLQPHPLNAAELYRQAFTELQRHARMRPAPGLLVLGFGPLGRVFGSLWLRLGSTTPQSFIIGRHDLCDLVVPDAFQVVSLRHLAVLMWQDPQEGMRLRVVDLHSPAGFFDEAGRVQDAVESEGPLFLGLGEVRVALLPCGPEVLDFADADSAYSALPPRRFEVEDGLPHEALGGHASQGVKGPLGAVTTEKAPFEMGRKTKQHPLKALDPTSAPKLADDERVAKESLPIHIISQRREHSRVTSVRGPINAELHSQNSVIENGEPLRGVLQLSSSGHIATVDVGLKALQRGILVGRYERCVLGWQDASAASDSLSRVHILLIMLGDQLFAVNTASTNGVFYHGQEISQTTLGDEAKLELSDNAVLRWRGRGALL